MQNNGGYPVRLRHKVLAHLFNTRTWLGWRVEIWWAAERLATAAWLAMADDRASYWFDPVPAYCCRRRYRAERRRTND